MAKEYIDREAVIDSMENAEFEIDCEENPDPVAWISSVIDVMLDCVCNEPAADVAPVVHGRWEPQEYTKHCGCGKSYPETMFRCSVCERIAHWQPYGLTYCPNCGAKMDGGKKDD